LNLHADKGRLGLPGGFLALLQAFLFLAAAVFMVKVLVSAVLILCFCCLLGSLASRSKNPLSPPSQNTRPYKLGNHPNGLA
jgi:hypothetical protein